MRTQNSNDSVYKREEIDKISRQIDDKIEEYLLELDKNDISEKGENDSLKRNIEKKLAGLNSKKEKIKKIKEIFEENPDIKRYFSNDPECEFMKDKGCVRPGYNVQAAIDEKNKLIVAIDVVNDSNDCHQLINMSEKVEETKKEIGIDKDVNTVKIADAGYYSEQEIIGAEDKGHNTCVANPLDESIKRGKKKGENIPSAGYGVENFRYDKEKDIYICPEGKELFRIGKKARLKNGKAILEYACKSCNLCDKRSMCTKNKDGRKIDIYVRKEDIDEYKKKIRSKEGKELIRRRKAICEHPFGTIKRSLGYNYFLLKGKKGALTEFSMISLIYNLKRVLNIFGIKELLEAI